MVSHTKMQEFTDQINRDLPVNAFWNGFKIRMFKRGNLVIGGSQDWTYYHNIDLIFKKVTFFNLPDSWNDTAIPSDNLFRLTTIEEFQSHHPNFTPIDRHIFAIDLCFDYPKGKEYEKHTFFILASNVFFEKHEAGDGLCSYEDSIGENDFLSKENRVIKA